MSHLSNHAEIARRGGLVDADDDFVVVACTECGTQYLYNEETLVLYLDPGDLANRVLNAQGIEAATCRGCGSVEWDFAELSESSPEVVSGPWAWCR